MKKEFKKKNRSRKLVLQGLYSLEIAKNNITYIEETLIKFKNKNKIDIIYFSTLINNIPKKSKMLDNIMKNNLNINTHINLIENIILKIIINEALILSNMFCSKKSYMLINKVLNNTINAYKISRLLL